MTDIEICKGAATLLVDKLLTETNATIGSITIGGVIRKDAPAGTKPKNYRITIKELSDKEVEHYKE